MCFYLDTVRRACFVFLFVCLLGSGALFCFLGLGHSVVALVILVFEKELKVE